MFGPNLGVGLLQFTVSVNAAVCCSEPDVAMTVEVTDCGVEGAPPPHPPNIKPTPIKLAASRTGVRKCQCFLKPEMKSTSARVDSESNGANTGLIDAELAGMLIVRVVTTADPEGATVAG